MSEREGASDITAVLCDKPPGSSLHPIQGSNDSQSEHQEEALPHTMQITTPKSREGKSFRLITLMPSWFLDRIWWTRWMGWMDGFARSRE